MAQPKGVTLATVARTLIADLLRASILVLFEIYAVTMAALAVMRPTSKPYGGTATATSTGQDANASAVSAFRYAFTYRPDRFPLDPQLRRMEGLFLGGVRGILTRSLTNIPVLLDTLLDLGHHVAARTVRIDNLLKDALRTKRVKQILILGAGYDTRAMRFAHLRKLDRDTVPVIELDQASVQSRKIQCIKRGLTSREHEEMMEAVEFVPCNFDHENALAKALANSKLFDPKKPTFVIWEGVTPYLDRSAIDGTLDTLTSVRNEKGGGPHWELAFDYADEELFDASADETIRVLLTAAARMNAPVKTGLPLSRDKLSEYLKSRGLKCVAASNTLALSAEVFPKAWRPQGSIPIALAVCEWL